MTRRCRCSIRAEGGPRPVGSGPTPSTTDPGQDPRHRGWPTYTADRKDERPAAHPANFSGVLQVHAYSGFNRLLEARRTGPVRLACCWAHCRGRFYDSHQATGTPIAAEALRRIGELYAIEEQIRGQPAEVRAAARHAQSRR